ncbi:hypothetical protein C8R47DRAFT_1214647 [Mycena vitilis]|nr:hypothetical protein C8R47DRAFT_1214647 [Mycena vitilis]
MSPVSAAVGINEKRFTDMAVIPGYVLAAVEQAKASDGGSTKSGGTTPFSTPIPREEGCLLTHSTPMNWHSSLHLAGKRRRSQVIDASLALWRAIMWGPVANQSPTAKTAVGAVSPPDASINLREPLGPHSDASSLIDALNESTCTETRLTMMDYLLGGYDFEELPDLFDPSPDGGSTSSSRSTTPTDASVATKGWMENASRG